ncbi:MAG: arginase family protein, partial [Candidatus Rokuibacteriota bacterium]
MIPAAPRFIACRASLSDARIVLFGIPFEGRINLRRGADHGPRELRLASDSIETYSPFLGRDLEDLAVADLGDCELGDGPPREQLARAREEIRGFWRPGLVPVMLG